MNEPTSSGVSGYLDRFVARLKLSHLLLLLTVLFFLDLVIPDPIVLVDEIVLGLITLLVARWQDRRAAKTSAGEEDGRSKPPPKNVTPEAKTGR